MITEVGQKLGPYEILGRLGDGGMGVVFRAWDERLQRAVAIKLIHANYEIPGMRERFLQEARAASGLNHPNICTVFDIGEQDGDPYLVMELLEGETLKERIGRGALTVEEILRYGQEIAEALDAAHAKGIVHRDIKPANIFLVSKPNGKIQAKVLDFGLAHIDAPVVDGWTSQSADLTVVGSTVGTVAYMSPEQGRGLALDGRSDLFSLGVVMYEMATRQAPFRGANSEMVFVQLYEQEPEPVRCWNDSIPKELERVILRLLAKDLSERFQSAKELQDALRKIAGKTGKGGWLKKGAAVVPLIHVPEPVAREKRASRRGLSTRGASAAGLTLAKRLNDARALDRASQASDGAAWNEEAVGIRPGEAGAVESLPEARRSESFTGERVEDAGVSGGPAWVSIQRWILAAAMTIAVVGGSFLLIRSGRLRPAALPPGDRLLLTKVQNNTGDKALDGTVMEGLEIELKQSPYLNVRGDDAYYAGLQRIGSVASKAGINRASRRVAHEVGAKAYLYGEVKRAATAYVISVDVLSADSNAKLASVAEVVQTREQIPAAIERLASAIRKEMGEEASSIASSNVPLDAEATQDVEALHYYGMGESATQQGRIGDALTAYQQAVSWAPKFVQAQMRLAWLYRAENAEVASASAASLALESSRGADEKMRLMAEFCYEMNASGNYERAVEIIRRYGHLYPHDVEGMVGLARVLNRQGHLVEALLAAEQAYGDDAYNADAYAEAEFAMLGLNRFDSVLQLEAQAKRLGVTPRGKGLAAAYLAGRSDLLAAEIDSIHSEAGAEHRSYSMLLDEGLYLDNSGQMAAGAAVWKAAMESSDSVPELISTRASMFAQSALDRALTGNCEEARKLVGEMIDLPRGPKAVFHAGMSEALCGDQVKAEEVVTELKRSYPQSTTVERYYVPNLQAAVALAEKKPSTALDLLAKAESYDQLSLTPYLSGLAHMAEKQSMLAAVDFETVLGHRGSAFSMGGTVYPMAEIGLARASAAAGDKAKSAEARQQLFVLWEAADRGQAVLDKVSANRR